MKLRKATRLALPAAALLVLVAAAAKSPRGLDLATARLVDLTHPFDRETVYWPTSPTSFALEKLSDGRTPGGWYYAANSFCAPEHGGTHLDAPRHFDERGWTDADLDNVLTIAGVSFTGARDTDPTTILTLSLTPKPSAGTATFVSTAGECTITIDALSDAAARGTFTCRDLSEQGGGRTIDVAGSFSAQAS